MHLESQYRFTINRILYCNTGCFPQNITLLLILKMMERYKKNIGLIGLQ